MSVPHRLAAAGAPVALLAAMVLACGPRAQLGHEATALLRVDPGPAPSVADFREAEARAERYAQLARSRPVAARVIEKLGLDERPESLLERISATSRADALTVRIEVRDDDATTARDVALALGNAMIERVKAAHLVEAETVQAEPETVQQQLQHRIDELFEDIIEAEDEPKVMRYRLVWFEKPTSPEAAER